jgi:colanic acid/amylovoran biosynthesis glycosyltransferase
LSHNVPGASTEARTVLVYRSELLRLSETFIASQSGALRRFKPVLVGLNRVEGMDLTDRGILTLSGRRRSRLRKSLFQYAGFAPGLVRRAEAKRPALVHAHFALDGAESLPLAVSLKVPLIVTLHGWDVCTDDDVFRRSWSGRRYLSRRTQLQEKAALFLCVSDFIRTKALERGFPEDKLLVHYIGVDTKALRPAPEKNRDRVVLFVARLVEKKGLSYLIEAMRTVQAECPGTRLVVIGDGPLRSRHQEEARRAGIAVEFLGGQPAAVVQDWMQRASVFALPSVRAGSGDSEGLGIVLCEAFALGLPAVAFANGGIPEVLASGTGLLAPERDSGALAGHLIAVLQSEGLRTRFRQTARERVVDHFDLASQTGLLEDIYDQVLSGEPVHGRTAQVACSY